MKTTVSRLAVASLVALLAAGGAARAQTTGAEEEDLAPAAATGELHLRDHLVRAVIHNGFATTEVEQLLVNPTARDLEAEWCFPLPEEASLSELSLWIAGQPVVGEVVEKEEARRIYEEERSTGGDAGLAEQESFLYLRVAVARVPAGGELRVRIVYFQPLDVDSGVGRYLYPLQEGGTDDMNRSFWTMDREARGRLSFEVTLQTAFPVDGLHSPSHPGFQAAEVAAGTWIGRWESSPATLDRDFVLLYRLRSDVPARVELLTHRRPGAVEGTFMAVVTPGSDLAPIEAGTDWVFVLDVSGSMAGEKMRTLARGAGEALEGMQPGDRFQVVTFNDRAHRITRGWVEPTGVDLDRLAQAVYRLEAGGGTDVYAALETAYDLLDADRPSALILISDGVCNVGHTEYRDFAELAREHDVRLFTFVMGNGANQRLLGDLAVLSGGFAKSVSMQDEVGAHLMLARDRMTHQALHGVEVDLPGATVMHPELLPSLYLGQQLVVFGRYDRPGPSQLEVRAKISGRPASWRVPVELPAVDESHPEIERLYALAAIADLERQAWLRTGDEAEARSAVVDMALRYSLVTDHTSMVVVAESRKAAWGLGDDNARRRAAERSAAARREAGEGDVQVRTDGEPLAGRRAAHAPRRAQERSRGGGRGAGAVGPLHLLLAAAMAGLALRRRVR